MRRWIIIMIILLLSISGASGGTKTVYWSDVGLGTFSYDFSYQTDDTYFYYCYDNTTAGYVYIDATWFVTYASGSIDSEGIWQETDGTQLSIFKSHSSWYSAPYHYNCISNQYNNPSYNGIRTQMKVPASGVVNKSGSMIITVSLSPITHYYISGEVNCINKTQIYVKTDENVYSLINETTDNHYNFSIINNTDYKLVFNDGHEYEFTCTGNITYDYNACSICTINIYDNCANLLNGAYTVIYDMDKNVSVVYSGYDNPINLTSDKVNTNDELKVIWSTWMGAVQKTCYAQFDHDINLYDSLVYWNMDVYVYNNESNPIEDANVDFNQDCVINGYPARNKYTDYDGLAEFTQCENKDANLVVSKDGYQTLSTTISGGWYDAYTSTYEISVVLQENTTSTWDVINNSINDTNATEEPQDIPDINDSPINVHLYFKDVNGNYVTQINDSDPYVRCYYDVIAMKPVSMILSFQSSLSGYWFTDVYTYPYTIDNNSYGYMNLSNDNFSDPIYMYRAYIHDSSYPEYDRYVYLSVVNQTEQSETHYENLTALCMFANTNKNGSIDYREGIKGYAYVVSDNASLRTVSLELYDNSTLIDYVNLTNSSFDEYDLYEWELGYNYTLGHNYSLVLKSSNNSILYCDNVIAYNLVGNKLIIKVTDSFNHNLNHVYVYVEHYGSINTGWLNYGTFEGLPNGETRYKATKNGYRSGVWKTVNLTDENEVVTYQLIQEAPTGSIASVRMSDSDVKDLYYPLMYFLFIIILIGALMNVIN